MKKRKAPGFIGQWLFPSGIVLLLLLLENTPFYTPGKSGFGVFLPYNGYVVVARKVEVVEVEVLQ